MTTVAPRHGLESRYSGPESSPGFLLWRVSNAWRSAQRQALAPLGLTHVSFVLLASLAWLEGEEPITQRRLAEHAALDVMMTSQVLRGLERDGLIVRLEHPSDSRARSLRTTSSGKRVAQRAIAVVEDCDERFFSRLGSQTSALTGALALLSESQS